jgi:hypothetical protein
MDVARAFILPFPPPLRSPTSLNSTASNLVLLNYLAPLQY